jgi:hypothetical protein
MALPHVSAGALITSTAWNNMVDEFEKKVTKTGDSMTGPLTVGGEVNARSLSISTADNSGNPMTITRTATNLSLSLGFQLAGDDGISYNFQIGNTGSGNIFNTRFSVNQSGTYVAGKLGVGTSAPAAKIEILHDSSIATPHLSLVEVAGNDFARLSFQNGSDRSKAWHIAGFAAGISNPQLNIWHSDQGDILSIQTLPKTVFVNPNWKLSFGNQTRQMLNLWSTEYGIGVQSGTIYFRSGDAFAWHIGGVHSDAGRDPGAGGKLVMRLHPNDFVVEVPNAWKLGGANTWIVYSDKKLKKDIKAFEGALDKLSQLRGVNFEWKEPSLMANQEGVQTGFVAQEVEKIFPEWVFTDQDGNKGIGFVGFEALVVESLKELKAEIKKIKTHLKI